ncbi:MAG: hypothetical protein CFH41_02225 [Alphaproteobacteria bacterium MarineAlpha11_Bin1]|nr:MAG: hypothetical protein CFH41_02225 [Alphaproteobacteria bacterium MarineAlpha11_Bin1]
MPAIEIIVDGYDNFLKVGTPMLIEDDCFHKACVVSSESCNEQSMDLAAVVCTV